MPAGKDTLPATLSTGVAHASTALQVRVHVAVCYSFGEILTEPMAGVPRNLGAGSSGNLSL